MKFRSVNFFFDHLFKIVVTLLLVIFAFSCNKSNVSSLAVINAKIWTGSSNKPWAEALFVKDNKIAAVNTNDEIHKLFTNPVVYDFVFRYPEIAIAGDHRQIAKDALFRIVKPIVTVKKTLINDPIGTLSGIDNLNSCSCNFILDHHKIFVHRIDHPV